MTEKKIKVTLKGRDLASGTIRKFAKTISNLSRNFRDIHEAGERLFRSIVGLVKAFGEFAARGTEFIGVQRAFNRITGDGAAALKLLRRETFGLIDDFELMKQANTSLALGASETTEQFAEQAKVAVALGRALGITATESLQKLTVGLARQSKLRLDDLGIIIDVTKANERYARSLSRSAASLSDSEKKLAFRNEAMRQANLLVAKLGEVELTAADHVKKASLELKNFIDHLSTLIGKSEAVEKFFKSLTSLMQDMSAAFAAGGPAMRDAFNELGRIAGNAFSIGVITALDIVPGKMLSFLDRIRDEAFANIQGSLLILDEIGAAARVAQEVSSRNARAGKTAPTAPSPRTLASFGVSSFRPIALRSQLISPPGGEIAGRALPPQGLRLIRMSRELDLEFAKITATMRGVADAHRGVGKEAQLAAATAITAFGGIAAGIIAMVRGGGFSLGGLLSTAGGIASFANPLVGAGLLAGGAVFGALSSGGKVTPVTIDSFSPRAESQMRETQMITEHITIITPEGDVLETKTNILRAQRRDATIRVRGSL